MKTQRRSSRLSTMIFGLALVTGACEAAKTSSPPAPAPPPPAPAPPAPAPPVPPPLAEPPRPVPKEAIVVVGDAENLGQGEQDLVDTLERDLRFDRVSIADDDDRARDFDPGLVIISSSVNAATLNDEWANQPVPIIVMNEEVYPFMRLAQECCALAVVEPEILAPDHPIVRGLDGDRLVLMNAVSIVPGASATVVIGERGCRRRAIIFYYDRGDPLAEINNEDPDLAPHRRVGFFVPEAYIPDFLPDEKTLLENTLLWTWSGR